MRFFESTRRELLTRGIGLIRTVPAGSVICPRFHLTETLIVADPVPVDAAWIDERGAISGPWMRILEQCVYGPGLGAYTVRTPKQTGSWSLRFRDRATGVVLGEQRFQIADRAALPRSEQLGSSYAVVAPLSQFADGACRIWVKNETAEYLCARPDDDKNSVTHPNLKGVVPGTLICTLRSRMSEPGRENTYEYRRLFLADLAPGEEYEVILPPGTLSTKPQPNRELVGALHSGEVLLPQNPSPQLRLRFDTKWSYTTMLTIFFGTTITFFGVFPAKASITFALAKAVASNSASSISAATVSFALSFPFT